jgi:hypothetical protein
VDESGTRLLINPEFRGSTCRQEAQKAQKQ